MPTSTVDFNKLLRGLQTAVFIGKFYLVKDTLRFRFYVFTIKIMLKKYCLVKLIKLELKWICCPFGSKVGLQFRSHNVLMKLSLYITLWNSNFWVSNEQCPKYT